MTATRLADPSPARHTGGMTDTVSTAALDAEVAKYARKGYAVTDRTATQVIMSRRRKVSALAILGIGLLALMTLGIVLLLLIPAIKNRKTDTVVITIDPATGRVSVRR